MVCDRRCDNEDVVASPESDRPVGIDLVYDRRGDDRFMIEGDRSTIYRPKIVFRKKKLLTTPSTSS